LREKTKDSGASSTFVPYYDSVLAEKDRGKLGEIKRKNAKGCFLICQRAAGFAGQA